MKFLVRAIRNDALWPDILLCAAICGFTLLFSDHKIGDFARHIGLVRGALYQLEGQVIAAILGFLIATAAILSTSNALQHLRVERYDVYKLLVKSLASSMVVSLAAIIYEIVAFICDQDEKSSSIYSSIGFAVFLVICLRIGRTIRRLYQSLCI